MLSPDGLAAPQRRGRPTNGKPDHSSRGGVLLPPGRSATRRPKLLSVLARDRGSGLQSDTNAAALVDKSALGRNSLNDIFGGQYRWHFASP
jgi:hypothetical protein